MFTFCRIIQKERKYNRSRAIIGVCQAERFDRYFTLVPKTNGQSIIINDYSYASRNNFIQMP